MPYRIGIKRSFWFGYKYYQVMEHRTEVLGAGARLVLKLVDGTVLALPNIHKKTAIVYPGYIDKPLE